MLAYLAGQAVELDEDELNGARRRALLLVAAGGDPHRELDVDDRAVKAVAADLYTDERREQLARAIDALVAARARPADRREARSFSPATSTSPGGCSALGLLAEELAG